MIADRDVIIAVAGTKKREFLGKATGKAVERALEERTTLVINDIQTADDEDLHIIQSEDREYAIKSQVISPIITQGDPIGAVIIVSKESGTKMGNIEIKLAKTAAGFVATQIR